MGEHTRRSVIGWQGMRGDFCSWFPSNRYECLRRNLFKIRVQDIDPVPSRIRRDSSASRSWAALADQ